MVRNVDDMKSIYEKFSAKDVYRIYNLKIRVAVVVFYAMIIMLGIYGIAKDKSVILFYIECFLLVLALKIYIVVIKMNLNGILVTDCDPYKLIEVNKYFIDKYKRKKQTKRIRKTIDLLYAQIVACYSVIKNEDDKAMEYIDKIDMNNASLQTKINIINARINIASYKNDQAEYEKTKKEYYELCANKKIPKKVAKQFDEQIKVKDLFFSGNVKRAIEISKECYDNANYKQKRVAYAYYLYNLYKDNEREEGEKYRQYVIKYGYKYIKL